MAQPIIKKDIEARVQFSNMGFNETLNNTDIPISWQTLAGYKNTDSGFNNAFYGSVFTGPGAYSPQIVIGSQSVSSEASKQSVFVRRYITSYNAWTNWTELFTTHGGTISGNLSIEKENNPSLYLINGSRNRQQGIFQMLDGGTLQILNYNDGNNYNGIYINEYSNSLANGLKFVHKQDNVSKSYNILHLGNINDYTINIYDRGIIIPDNTDLDTYITPGNFYSAGSTNSATHTNPPITSTGYKLLVQKGYASNVVFQFANANTYNLYYRMRNTSSNWTSWNTILTNYNYSSYALPLSGGTLTGQLKANKNISIINANPWVLLNDSDSNYNFYVQVSGSTLALGNGFDKSALINANGQLTLQAQTSIADNIPAGIYFHVAQTDNNIKTTSTSIRVYDDHDANTYGCNMVISAGGNLILGGGESALSCYNTDFVNNTGESTYITADTSIYFYTNCNTYANKKSTVYINTSGALYGAVWNDYAEYRKTALALPGEVVAENGDGTLSITTERLQPGCVVVSDTFGFSIGQTDDCQTPIAVSGRVLAYPAEDRYSYKPGDAVCSAPNGRISKMTRREIIMYPERIIGTVSEIPEYERWGEGNVLVDGRIWISIR